MSNVDVQLSAGLNIDQSYQQIKNDIETIQKRLSAAGVKINISAQVDAELKKTIEKLGDSKEPAVVGRKLGSTMASNLINEFNIKSKEAQQKIKQYMNELFNMTVGEVRTGTFNPDFLNVFTQLGEVIKNNANIIQSRMGIYDTFYQYFKGIEKIKIPDIVRKDLGEDWNTLRMVSAKTFTTDKGGIELDSIYQEMASKFKDLFTGTSDPTEQFQEIVAAIKAYRADIDRLAPVDLSKMLGFEDDMWATLTADLGLLRNQITAQLPQIEAEVEKSAENIKKSLLNINVGFQSGGSLEQLTSDVKAYFQSIDGTQDKDISLQFFKNANEEITSFTATLDRGNGVLEKYSFSMNELGQYAYTGGSVVDKSGKAIDKLTERLRQQLKDLPADIDYLEAKFKGAKFQIPSDVTESFQKMRDLIKQINSTDDIHQKMNLYQQLSEQLDQITKKYRQMNIEQKNSTANSRLQSSKNLLGINIDTWINKNTAAAKVFSTRLEEVKSKLQSADSTEFESLKHEFHSIQAEAKQMGLVGSKSMQAVKNEVNSLISRMISLTAAIQTFKKMVGTAKELDSSLFNLQVATGRTREETKALLSEYNQMAKELGATTVELAEGADTWIRTGRSLEETETLVRDSMVLSKIGLIDAGEATEDLTAVLNGYKMEAESALEIVSKLSNVDMNAAASAGGLAQAMSKTATSANQAGVSIDELIGMLATMKDVTQASDDEIGNAMKSIVSRYSQIKVNKFTDYETGEDLSNVETALGKIGVKIRENLTDYRDLTDVLSEVAAKYGTLNDVEKNAVNTALFGTYQSNKGAVLLANWDKVEKLTQVSVDSSTEALDKFSAYTDSLQAHINSMTASYEHLASVVADSEFLKGATDSASKFLDVIALLTEKLGVLSVAAGAITGGAALKGMNVGFFDNNGTDITFLGKTIEEINAASAAGERFGGIFTKNVKEPMVNAQSVISNYNTLVQQQCVSQAAINNLTDDMDMRKYLTGLKGAEAEMSGYTAALNMTAASTLKLKVQTVALNMALNMALMAGATAAFWALGKACEFVTGVYDKHVNQLNYLCEAAEESSDAYNDLQADVESVNDELETTAQRIDELNAKEHLTFIEQDELQRLKDTNDELERELANKRALANVAKEEAREDAIAFFDADAKPSVKYLGWDISQVDAGNERYGHAEEGLYYGSQTDVVKEQIADYEALLAEQKRLKQEILDFQTENPSDYAKSDEYQNLTMQANVVNNQVKQLRTQLKDTITEFDKFDNSLDPEKDAELLQTLKEIFTLYQGVFGGDATPTQSFEEVWDSDEFQSARAELEKMARAGTLNEEVFSGNETYNELLKATGKTAQETCEHIYALLDAEKDTGKIGKTFSKSEMISEINSLSEGFESLDKIMASMKDSKNPFDYALLDDKKFNESFSGLGDAYTDFMEKVSSSPKDLASCQNAYDNLVTAYINSSGIISGLSDETASLTAAMLSNMGVSNAEEVVTNALIAKHAEAAAQKYYEANATHDLADATLEEYVEFLNEADASDATKQALAQLELAKLAVNKVKIDTASDIDQVINLANAAGASAEALAELGRAKAILAKAETSGLNGSMGDLRMYEEAQKIIEEIESGTYQWKFNLDASQFKGATYDGGTKTNKSSSGNSGKSKVKEEFDWIKRKYDYLQKNHDIYSEIANDETASYTERVEAIKEMMVWDKKRLEEAASDTAKYSETWKKYMAENLTADEANLVMFGGDEIEKLEAKEGTAEAERIERLKKGVELYDLLQESLERQRDTQTEVNEHLKKELELQQEIIEARQEQLQSEIALADAHMDYINASGGVVTAGYYEEQIRLSKEISDSYEDQIENLREQQSLVDKNSAEYYSLEAKIVDCESSIIDCKKEQAEWNEAIKRLPVERMEKYINMLKAIKQELEDYLDYQETIGQTTTKDQYQQLMEINQTQIDKLQEQAEELQNLLNDYEYGSDKFNEVAEELSDIQNETANLVNEMQEYNNAILNIPIEKLESANEELERYANTLSGIMDDYDSVLSAVTDSIENETSALEDLKQQTEETYESQISALKQQSDFLDKQNEKKQKELAVEQALYDLNKANNQKSTQVIRDGKKIYESSIDDRRNAEQKYQDSLLEKKKYELSSEIERLEEERDALLEGYDDEIERLNTISEKWQKIADDAAKYADALKADEILGEDWQEKVLLGNDDDIYQMFKNLYDSTNQSKVQVDEQIESNERIAEMMKVFVERFTDGSITYEQALNGISQLSASMDKGYSSLEQLSGLMNLDGIEHIADIADSMKSQTDESITMLEQYMEIAKINHDAIADYTSTWEEMSKLIEEQLASLKAAAEALEEWVENQKYHGYSSDGDSDSSNIDYTDHKSSGTITTSADGRGYDNPDYKDERTYHKGIEKGLIGSPDSSREEILKRIATEDLKPGETYFKGLIGEAVFTKEQQEQLIENFNNFGYDIGMFTPTPKAIDATKYIKSENKTYNDVNVTFGDIKLEGVQDPDGFAKAVKNQFGGIVRQEVSKAKYRNW